MLKFENLPVQYERRFSMKTANNTFQKKPQQFYQVCKAHDAYKTVEVFFWNILFAVFILNRLSYCTGKLSNFNIRRLSNILEF